jgi:hypothetical protein
MKIYPGCEYVIATHIERTMLLRGERPTRAWVMRKAYDVLGRTLNLLHEMGYR